MGEHGDKPFLHFPHSTKIVETRTKYSAVSAHRLQVFILDLEENASEI